MLLRIVVRAKKDRDAVRATLSTFYKGWNATIDVVTLKGERNTDRIRELLLNMSEERRLVIFLHARELKLPEDFKEELPLNVVVEKVDKRKIRNARIFEIYQAIERGKARFRLTALWMSTARVYAFYRDRGSIEGIRIPLNPKPFFDLYHAIGEEHRKLLEQLIALKLGDNPLIIKMERGIHKVLQGDLCVARLLIPDEGTVEVVDRRCSEVINVDLRREIAANEPLLRFLKKAAEELFKAVDEMHPEYDYDRVIVPWSGGKDSTAALLLAMEHFGRDLVVPVYVDTGCDLPGIREYIEMVSEKLGVSPHVEYAPIPEMLALGNPWPTRENRWCTRLKIEALYRAVGKLSDKPLIVVGDRDTESALRLRRAPIRSHNGFLQVAPLKNWSSAFVQLYLLSEGIPLNPLYEIGFYRLGCIICPAFRSWELMLLSRLSERDNDPLGNLN